VCTDVLWPLVARRNLRRFARIAVRIPERDRAAFEPSLALLSALDDATLVALFTGPELTSWIAGVEGNPPDAVPDFAAWLAQFVLPVAIRHGLDLAEVPVATSAPGHLELLYAGRRVLLDRAGPTVRCAVRGGVLTVAGATDPPWVPIPTLDARISVSGGPNGWLDHAFPERDQIADCDLPRLRSFVDRLAGGAAELHAVWPEAWDEVRAILRWIVPLNVEDSFYVPGFRGLVAIGENDRYPLACRLFHETSHNKLSSILELASASTNPDERVFSPFARGKGPVTSLLQSSWSFAREYQLLQRLKAHGYLHAGDIEGLELKFRVFLDKGLPSLRRSARLTPLGDAVLTTIEQEVR
jgi:HEXXH motif-containing protein